MWASEPPRVAESKFRLLYLGNDLKFLSALRQLLKEPAYMLVGCADRGTAVMFLRGDISYDLALLDFNWRGQDGWAMARLAQSLKHRKKMPIMLVVPEEVSPELKTLADRAGVKKCVMKTPNAGAVSEAIRQQLEKPRRRR